MRRLRQLTVRASLTEWARYRGFEPAAHHQLIINEIEAFLQNDDEVLLIFAPPGSAKALALDTPIPTPDGWREMGSLRVGDRVFDETGHPCNIIRVSQIWRDRPVYKLRTDCGDEIVADEDHEWLVRLCGKRRKGVRHEPIPFKLKTTKYLCRRRSKRPMIERAKALDLPEISLPIDPYFLGVWLGDGHSSGIVISSAPSDQIWLRKELWRLGYETKDRSAPAAFGVSGVRHLFARLGLLNDPFHSTYGRKYIPAQYMRASRQQRMSLLQGLIDTDGTISKEQGCTTFCSTNEGLAYSVQELVRSLGVKAFLTEGRAKLYGKDCGLVFHVSFYLAGSARMPRKAALCRDQQRTPNTYIEVEPYGRADTVCIEVDSPSHLFLCGRSMTPTHNSSYVSILLPSYYLARFPKNAILAATHSGDFALRWGRRVRNDVILESEMLGIQLASDSQAADRWALSTGGEYYGVGAGVGIAGYRADLGVIDDLFGTREDAFSAHIRQKRWDWYVDDFSPRLKPRAKRIIISTRWHEEDVAGRVVDQISKRTVRGKAISIPAKAEAKDLLGREVGEYLWDDPKGYNYGDFLRARERETDAMMWSALYQQRPAPETGDYWKAEWLRPYSANMVPDRATLSIYGGSDWAVTSGGGDYTVHVVIGVDPDDKLWLLDMWRGQEASDVWVDRWCDLVKKWKPMGWAEEKGQIGSGVGPFRDKRAQERQAYVAVESFPTRGDKGVRAQSMRGRIAQLGLYVPTDKSWYADFRSELMSFPAGAHDDIHDSLGLVGQLLDMMTAGRKPKVPEVTKTAGYSPTRTVEADSFKVM